jgi:hypothetical protein
MKAKKTWTVTQKKEKAREGQKWSIPWTHNIGFHFAQIETSWES